MAPTVLPSDCKPTCWSRFIISRRLLPFTKLLSPPSFTSPSPGQRRIGSVQARLDSLSVGASKIPEKETKAGSSKMEMRQKKERWNAQCTRKANILRGREGSAQAISWTRCGHIPYALTKSIHQTVSIWTACLISFWPSPHKKKGDCETHIHYSITTLFFSFFLRRTDRRTINLDPSRKLLGNNMSVYSPYS